MNCIARPHSRNCIQHNIDMYVYQGKCIERDNSIHLCYVPQLKMLTKCMSKLGTKCHKKSYMTLSEEGKCHLPLVRLHPESFADSWETELSTSSSVHYYTLANSLGNLHTWINVYQCHYMYRIHCMMKWSMHVTCAYQDIQYPVLFSRGQREWHGMSLSHPPEACSCSSCSVGE